MKTISMFAFFALLLCASACTVQAAVKSQNNTDTNPLKLQIVSGCLNQDVSVTVTNDKGKPLPQVKVRVICRSTLFSYGWTDATGVYKFKANKVCSFDILANKPDYNDAEIFVNVTICNSATTSSTTSTTMETTTTEWISTTTTEEVTTTTEYVLCNGDGTCNGEENYANCPSDCPSGSKDGYCDGMKDGRCDPDCYRRNDPDCLCNNNSVCETGFENRGNCPQDCPSGAADGFCDGEKDSICDQDCNNNVSLDSDCTPPIDPVSVIIPAIIIIGLFGSLALFNIKREMGKVKTERGKEDLVDSLKERLKQGEDPEVLRKELIAGGHDPVLLEKAEKGLWN
jgi:hypothetical protein